MKILEELKTFAIKGNMTDMAIGIIIGAAFKDMVNVLVKKVIMPPLSLVTEGVNFENKKIVLRDAYKVVGGKELEQIAISYGEVINVVIDFFIIAFVVFFVIKFRNSLKDKAQDPKNVTVKTPKGIQLLHDMKELMKEQNLLLKSLGDNGSPRLPNTLKKYTNL